MRSEEEVREFYRQYVYLCAKAFVENKPFTEQTFYGAAIACGRTLGKDMRRIEKDLRIVRDRLASLEVS